MPDIKQKLIELICSTEYGNSSLIGNNFQKGFIEKIADHIIASGYIEELQNEAYDLGVDSALHNHFGLSWEDAAGLRKEITRLQEATKWIPVTERLPEYVDGHVLVTDGKRVKISCRNAFYNTATGETRCAQGYGAGMSITHWMPLPAVPEEVHADE